MYDTESKVVEAATIIAGVLPAKKLGIEFE